VGAVTLRWLYVAQVAAISVTLTVLVYWIAKHRDGEARSHLLRLFGTAAVWAWYVTLRNVVDVTYTSRWWGWGNLAIGAVALYATWRCVRWVLR
jgi:hypothetical protein